MKNQRGVTLIALVVTIIVLIILAGVAIAALTGENGLISRSREAKALQIRGEVGDRVTLAIAAAKLAAEKEATTSAAGFLAQDKLVANGVIDKALKEDLGDTASELGYTITYTNGSTTSGSATDGKITIQYATDEYDQAMNNSGSTITYNITVHANTFSFDENTPTLNPVDIVK